MKKRRIITALVVAGFAVLAICLGIFVKQKNENAVQNIEPIRVSSKAIPTFFFHGYGSSYHAEEKMVQAIKNAGATNAVIRINVTPRGKVVFHGKLPKNAKNPIVEVNFDDNRLKNYRNDYTRGYRETGSVYVKNAIQAVTRRYHYHKINIVAHSMGNLETAYYFAKYPKLQRKIAVEHFISIAGHYDGIIGINDKANQLRINPKTGKPSVMRSEYRGLLSLRKTFPRNTRVLNIFGNLEDGTNGDGDVSNASSRSLKYLVSPRAKSYHELMIRGKRAQHSKLHNNGEVNRAIVRFLFK